MTSIKKAEILSTLGTAGDLAKRLTDEDSIARYRQGSLTVWVFAHMRTLIKIWLALALLEITSILAFGASFAMLEGAGLVALLVALGIGSLLHGRGQFLSDLLQPLADSRACADALLIVACSDQAAKWRDSAVASGRALRGFDLEVMERRAVPEYEVARRQIEADRERHEDALCRQLHSVS